MNICISDTPILLYYIFLWTYGFFIITLMKTQSKRLKRLSFFARIKYTNVYTRLIYYMLADFTLFLYLRDILEMSLKCPEDIETSSLGVSVLNGM